MLERVKLVQEEMALQVQFMAQRVSASHWPMCRLFLSSLRSQSAVASAL